MSFSETVSKTDRLSDEQRECIENCEEASAVCEWCGDECLGDADMEECARLSRDVADLTSLHARFMARDSDYSGQLTAACAACAEECSQHDADHCQVCAEVLTDCAETCRQMAGA